MKRINPLFWLFILTVALLGAALLFLDFRVARTELSAEHQMATYSFSVSERTSLPLEQRAELYVLAPQPLADNLVAALADSLQNTRYVGHVQVRQPPLADAPAATIVLQIEEPSILWTPFYARSRFSVQVAYASDGEVAWIDEDVVRLVSGERPTPTVRVRGDFQVTDVAYGLLSRPGYYHYLGDRLAQRISDSLAGTLVERAR